MLNPSTLSDPREIASILRRRKWFLLLPLVLVTVTGLVASLLIAPEYESFVVVTVGSPVRLSDTMERMLGEFRQIIGVTDAGDRDVRAVKAEMISGPFVARVIEVAELTKDAEMLAEANQSMSIYPDLTPEQIAVNIMARDLKDNLTLEYITRSHLKITVTSDDPARARLLASSIGRVFVEEKERETQQAIFSSLDFSYDQLSRYEKLLQEKLDQKSRVDQQIDLLEAGGKNAFSDIRKDVRSEIQRRQLELSDLRNQQRSLEASLEKLALPAARVTESPQLVQQRSRLDSLLKSAVQNLLQGTAGDAEWSSIQGRVAESEDAVAREHQRLIREQYPNLKPEWADQLENLLGIRLRLSYLEWFVSQLKSGLADLDVRWVNLPALRGRQDSLAQEILSAQRLRDRLKDQQQTFEISQALAQHSQYKVVEEARLRLAPVWPNRPLIALCALLAGLAIGFGAVIAMEISDLTLNSAQEVESFLDLPVVGVLPKVESTGELPKPKVEKVAQKARV